MTLTQEQLKKILDYNPDTGQFTWKVSPSFTVNAGDPAGYNRGGGYLGIGIDKGYYYVHRLAFLYMYGYFPKEIDHINGNRSDNRIINLREVNKSQNAANRRTRNRTGYKGVVEYKPNRFRATIMKDKKTYRLGEFKSALEAAKAYNLKAIELFGEYAKINELGAINEEESKETSKAI